MKLQDAQYVSIGQAAKLIGLSIPTLRRYEKSGKFSSCFRTFCLHRRYDVNDIRKLLNKENDNKTICYARVSSAGQKNDLTTQVEKLTTYCEDKHYDNVEVIILENEDKDFHIQLTDDIISLMNVFCGKLYGKRSHKNKQPKSHTA